MLIITCHYGWKPENKACWSVCKQRKHRPPGASLMGLFSEWRPRWWGHLSCSFTGLWGIFSSWFPHWWNMSTLQWKNGCQWDMTWWVYNASEWQMKHQIMSVFLDSILGWTRGPESHSWTFCPVAWARCRPCLSRRLNQLHDALDPFPLLMKREPVTSGIRVFQIAVFTSRVLFVAAGSCG